MAFEWFLLQTFTKTNAFYGTRTKKMLRDCYCLDLVLNNSILFINALRLGYVSYRDADKTNRFLLILNFYPFKLN